MKTLGEANRYLGARVPGLRLFRHSSGYFFFDSETGNPPPSICANAIRQISAADLDDAIQTFNQQKKES